MVSLSFSVCIIIANSSFYAIQPYKIGRNSWSKSANFSVGINQVVNSCPIHKSLYVMILVSPLQAQSLDKNV